MKKSNIVVLIGLLCPLLLSSAGAQELPYKTIEEAVRASGGTYFQIDTSNPDAAENAVDMIFDKGLTSNDNRGANPFLRSGIELHETLPQAHAMAVFSYRGRKGEHVRVHVNAEDFDPELYLLDANGKFLGSDKNYDGSSVAEISSRLTYDGLYQVQVQAKGGRRGVFRIGIDVDDAGVIADKRGDDLIAGRTYAIRELDKNQSVTPRRFFAEAYLIAGRQKCPPCPPEAYSCPLCPPATVLISDRLIEKFDRSWVAKKNEDVIQAWFDPRTVKVDNIQVLRQYRFELEVVNSSRTNAPRNTFQLLSVEEIP